MSEDRWEEQLIECSFGGVRLDVQSLRDVVGRVLAVHQIPHREGAPVRDQGAVPRETECKIIFFRTAPEDDPRERFYFFKAIADEGRTQTFVHPLTGRYRAKVGEMSFSIAPEPREVITVECTFHEDSDVPATFEATSGVAPSAGLAEVEASAADLNASLVEVNDELPEDAEPLTSTAGVEAVAVAAGWADAVDAVDDPLTVRKVNLQLVALSNKISAETDRLELAMHPERQPIMRSLSALHANLRRAADAFTEQSPRIVEITVIAPTNVYTLAARTYPGENAERRAEQLLRLNDIRNPARIEAGTRLKAYSRNTSTRLRSPRLFGR